MEATPSTTLIRQWWYESITVKRGTLGENLGLEIGAAYNWKTWARIIFQPKSIDLTADRKIHLTGLPFCLFVRILGWWFPNHKRHDALKRYFLEQKQLTLLEILTPGNGWKIPGIAQVQRKLQWTICWLATSTTSSTWAFTLKVSISLTLWSHRCWLRKSAAVSTSLMQVLHMVQDLRSHHVTTPPSSYRNASTKWRYIKVTVQEVKFRTMGSNEKCPFHPGVPLPSEKNPPHWHPLEISYPGTLSPQTPRASPATSPKRERLGNWWQNWVGDFNPAEKY